MSGRVEVVKIGSRFIPYRQQRKLAEFFRLVRGLKNSCYLVRPDKGINLWEFLHQVVAVSLDQAAGNNDALGLALGLQVRGFENRIDRFLFRRFDKAAGVHHDRIGLIGVIRNLPASLLKRAHHHLAIYEVLRTSQTDKSNFFHVINKMTDELLASTLFRKL